MGKMKKLKYQYAFFLTKLFMWLIPQSEIAKIRIGFSNRKVDAIKNSLNTIEWSNESPTIHLANFLAKYPDPARISWEDCWKEFDKIVDKFPSKVPTIDDELEDEFLDWVAGIELEQDVPSEKLVERIIQIAQRHIKTSKKKNEKNRQAQLKVIEQLNSGVVKRENKKILTSEEHTALRTLKPQIVKRIY